MTENKSDGSLNGGRDDDLPDEPVTLTEFVEKARQDILLRETYLRGVNEWIEKLKKIPCLPAKDQMLILLQYFEVLELTRLFKRDEWPEIHDAPGEIKPLLKNLTI
jgi:hypothetical protein